MTNQIFSSDEANKLYQRALLDKERAFQKVIETAVEFHGAKNPRLTKEAIADNLEVVLHEYARAVALCTKLEIMKEQING